MKKQQESLKNMVYQAILNGIFTDEYKPNQKTNNPLKPNEKAICLQKQRTQKTISIFSSIIIKRSAKQ